MTVEVDMQLIQLKQLPVNSSLISLHATLTDPFCSTAPDKNTSKFTSRTGLILACYHMIARIYKFLWSGFYPSILSINACCVFILTLSNVSNMCIITMTSFFN